MRADAYETKCIIQSRGRETEELVEFVLQRYSVPPPDTTTPTFQSLFALGIIEIPKLFSPSTESLSL